MTSLCFSTLIYWPRWMQIRTSDFTVTFLICIRFLGQQLGKKKKKRKPVASITAYMISERMVQRYFTEWHIWTMPCSFHLVVVPGTVICNTDITICELFFLLKVKLLCMNFVFGPVRYLLLHCLSLDEEGWVALEMLWLLFLSLLLLVL